MIAARAGGKLGGDITPSVDQDDAYLWLEKWWPDYSESFGSDKCLEVADAWDRAADAMEGKA